MSIRHSIWVFAISILLTGCAQTGPGVDKIDNYRVFTPVFADNRVLFVGPRDKSQVSSLSLQTTPIPPKANVPVIKANDPISITVNSVEMPQVWPERIKKALDSTIDVAVIVDAQTGEDGEMNSYVVWYQRGVTAGQSLNFSNLLVHSEPRWDDRIAPMFRIRVMYVVSERNAETLEVLDQVSSNATSIMQLITVPLASQALNIASQAARLTLASQTNQNLLDYTVQFYGQTSVAKAGGAGLGVLRAGEFVTVGKPNTEDDRKFWTQEFVYDNESRVISVKGGAEVHAPIARVTLGTFESIIPKIVIERSTALTQHLAQQNARVNLDQLKIRAASLQRSIEAFAEGEDIIRFGQISDQEACKIVKKYMTSDYNDEDRFYLARAFKRIYSTTPPLRSLDEVKAHIENKSGKKC